MFWEQQGIIILSCDRISGRAVRGNEVTKYVSIHGWGGGRKYLIETMREILQLHPLCNNNEYTHECIHYSK